MATAVELNCSLEDGLLAGRYRYEITAMAYLKSDHTGHVLLTLSSLVFLHRNVQVVHIGLMVLRVVDLHNRGAV